MRLSAYIVFIDRKGALKEVFIRIGKARQYDMKDAMQSIELYKDSAEYEILIKELLRQNISYDERIRNVFSEIELSESKYLFVTSSDYWGYPQPEDAYKDICFDFSSACPVCKNGAKQIKPFRVKGPLPKNKTREIVSLNWEFQLIIRDRIVSLIKRGSFSGCAFREIIIDRTSKPAPGWKQLVISNELPPMSEDTIFPVSSLKPGINDARRFERENASSCGCGKIGRNLPGVVYYKSSDLSKFCDFNITNEWLGGGYRTYQHEIISNRVYKLLIAEKVKYLEFNPIAFV